MRALPFFVLTLVLLVKLCRGDIALLSEFEEHDKVATVLGRRADNVFSGLIPADGFETPIVPITIAIYFDTRPFDIGFKLSSVDGSVIYAQETAGAFTIEEYDQKLYTKTVDLKRGETYMLQVEDMEGNGLQEPGGYYAIYYGRGTEEEILMEDQFESGMHEVIFVAKRLGTKFPTSSPQPTTSPAPTHSPTMCIEETLELYGAEDNRKDHRPHLKSSLTAFPDTSNYCTPHRSYTHCTNEKREDCQWQFLGASGRQGVCRVDPVSKCIREGNCVCETVDFKGGDANMAKGILLHVPVSVTSQDISPFRDTLTHYEVYRPPRVQNEAHPQDEDFYISRVDFTARKLVYDFSDASPLASAASDMTIAFKLHNLYWDLPMMGRIFKGLGLSVHIDTSLYPETININGYTYQLKASVKKWTCTSVVITESSLFVAGHEITRSSNEKREANGIPLEIGQFSGELFDFRIYRGTMSWREIREFGAACTNPEDPAALQYKRDIVNPYYTYGCQPDFERLPADEGGPVPTDAKQTYGSGPFGTLWMKPRINPFNTSEYVDVPEGDFDSERFFQQSKLQAYMWEKFLFDNDMIGFNQEPYQSFESSDQVSRFAGSFWNNPCRWVYNFNNGWQYPIYGTTIPKFSKEKHGKGDPDAVFDLPTIYKTRADWIGGISFVAHEMFHGVQGHLGNAFIGKGSRWLAESTAEFGADIAFPASSKIIVPVPLSPSFPLSMSWYRDQDRAQHFMTEAVSINDWVRGGHIYGSWLLWWFLAEHAGLPHLVGQVYSTWHRADAYTAGELFHIRVLVENANLDFGDVWATCIAHMRTWDFPKFGELYREAEQEDFEKYMSNPDVQPPIPRDTTLEGRKVAAWIDPFVGTYGNLVTGPSHLRPGANGWNCLTMRGVGANQFVSIKIQWEHGLGFDDSVKPERLPRQQHGCDADPRFYNSVVVAHNEVTGKRRYWKLKGRDPPTLNLAVGSTDPITIHILLVPTPPTDYVGGNYMLDESGWDDRMSPLPIYEYKYSVALSKNAPQSVDDEAPIENGIMKFDEATPGWWPVECTCMEDPRDARNRCVIPTFDGVGVSDPPSEVPATEAPSPAPTASPTVSEAPSITPTVKPTLAPSKAPSFSQMPSITPSMVASEAPSESPSVSMMPSEIPSESKRPSPSPSISQRPTPLPSASRLPTVAPTATLYPSFTPTESGAPSMTPTISAPPSQAPSTTSMPTQSPSVSHKPSQQPSLSAEPSGGPSHLPTSVPTQVTSALPSSKPSTSLAPSPSPTMSLAPSAHPSHSGAPTGAPSLAPTSDPTEASSSSPTVDLSPNPTSEPTVQPTASPTEVQSSVPTGTRVGRLPTSSQINNYCTLVDEVCQSRRDCCSKRCFFSNPRDAVGRCVV